MSVRATLVASALIGGAMIYGAALATGCDGQENQYVFSEPIVVRGAQFFSGPLPGTIAVDSGAEAGVSRGSGPTVTSIQALNTTVYAGEGGKALSGRATDDASAVAIRLGTLGTGYWVLPLGNPDPQYPGELSWGGLIDFNTNIASGIEALEVVAVTGSGVYGVQAAQNLCVASSLPADPGSGYLDDITACSPTVNPPEAVFSLTWDANVDLDLHVLTPDGVDVNPKNPLVDPVDAGATPARTAARIDRDSIAQCTLDGWRREDLIFPSRPASGSIFQISANLFEACGLPSVTFTLTAYEAAGTLNKDRHLVQRYQQSGRLTSFDADGDAPGLFIASYPF